MVVEWLMKGNIFFLMTSKDDHIQVTNFNVEQKTKKILNKDAKIK